MMVAAHSSNLEAAAACGLRTAHVARSDEYRPERGESGPALRADIPVWDLTELADRLGA